MSFGKYSTFACTVSTTWASAGTVGAGDGFYPTSIDPITLKGEPSIDDASGFTNKTNYQRVQDIADPTITLAMRWNGLLEWLIVARWIGDDTKTGPTGNIYTHTMNYQEVNSLGGGITLAWRSADSDVEAIAEIPTLKVPGFTLDPADGFWNLSTTQTIGNSLYVNGDGNITADGTAIGNVTYTTSGQRMKFKANAWRMNTQSGGALGAGDVVSDVSDMSLSFEDSYLDMRDTLLGSTLPLENAQPIPSGEGKTINVSYQQKTYDYDTHRNDLSAGNEYKADLKQNETIGSDAHTFTVEFGRLIPMDPQVAVERGLRIGMTHNYEAIKPSSTPTGLSTANPIHIVLANTSNLTYETNT